MCILTIGLPSEASAATHKETRPKNSGKQLNSDPEDQSHYTSNDLLYTLLVAEIAASRNLKNIACENFLKVAYLSKDPKIAEEATINAINFESPKDAIVNSLFWAKIDPKNLQAQLIAMTLLISQSVEEATPYLRNAVEINPAEIDQHLIEIQSRLSNESALKLQEAISKIAEERPNDPYLQFTAAKSASIQGDIKQARHWVDSALKLKPDLTRAIQLNAQLIRHEKDSDTPALEYLQAEIIKFPKDEALRLFYANALIDINKTEEAKKIILAAPKDTAVSGDVLLLLGEIYLKEKDWKNTEDNLTKALSFPNSKDTARYLLGEMEEQQHHEDLAISWFSDVAEGPFHIPARLRAVILLKKAKQYKDAIYVLHDSSPKTMEEQKYLLLSEMDLLIADKEYEDALQLSNDLLAQIPEDMDVLFMRGITATKLKKWELAEEDYKKVLDRNPDDPNVLNALAYTLSFEKQRLQEALNYSMRALQISPHNPDFMDSVGWIYYQMGDQQNALIYLKEAHELSPDNTIAAHFGEVLWKNDQKKAALTVWKKALKEDAENEELLDTLKRLKVDIAGSE